MAMQSASSSFEDLCNWEFVTHDLFLHGLVNDDGADYDAIYAEVQSLDSFSSSIDELEELVEIEHSSGPIDIIPHDAVNELLLNHQNQQLDDANFDVQNQDVANKVELLGLCASLHNGEIGSNGFDDEYQSDDGFDLDDELVPWEVADRLGRQRLRKLGKRSFAKMTKSKKMAHIYIKPGCVRGKHGLGLKAY